MKYQMKRIMAFILACSLALSCLAINTFAEEAATSTDLPKDAIATEFSPDTPQSSAEPSPVNEIESTVVPIMSVESEAPDENSTVTEESTPTQTSTETATETDVPQAAVEVPTIEPDTVPTAETGTETPTIMPDTPSAETDNTPTAEPEVIEESPIPTDEPTTVPPVDDRTPIQAAIEDQGYTYVATIDQTQVFGSAELTPDSLLYTTDSGNHVLLATKLTEFDSILVIFLDVDSTPVEGYVPITALLDDALSTDYLVAIDEVTVADVLTDVGYMTLCIVGGQYPVEPTPEPVITEAPDMPMLAAIDDYLSVSTSTRVFQQVDDFAVEDTYSAEYIGFFVNTATVKVTEVMADKSGNAWYQVRFLYGADAAHGGTTWTAYDTVYVMAAETQATDKTECTVTDYAYSKEFLELIRKTTAAFSATAMDGFSLKSISVDIGSFYEGQSGLYGSSGKDSDYPQIARSAGHGTIYATPHYLSGYTVYCLEHNEQGPGEDSSPTGPYVLVDMDTFVNDASTGGGPSGVRFSEKTMRAIGWVLRHTYPFMALDRSDSNNLTWSRAAGQFAIREVIKQLEGAQYVRDYWNMDNFYSFSDGAPSAYLTYARWLAKNGIARAGISGQITLSNQSTSVSGSSYIGSVKVTTDADLIRIPLSVGTLTGNSGGSDSSYYYAKSGDILQLTSSQRKFTMTMESVSSDSEEANFLVGIPSVALQKVLVPTDDHPDALQSASATFELSQGAITVTKKSTDGILLAGTVFDLMNTSGTVLKTATTAANGTASFTGLEPGAYIVREKTAPQGYKLAATSTQNVVVKAGVTSAVTFTNERISGKIRIVKTDSQTGNPLSGATFSVICLSSSSSDNASNVGKVVATITTNASGIAETGLLPCGQYKIQETGIPEGYLDDSYSATIWIK